MSFRMRLILALIFFVGLQLTNSKRAYVLIESWVCDVKQSCTDCLRLPHCAWCKTESKCFSKNLAKDYCKNDSTDHQDFGFSLEENARCACDGEPLERNCLPAGQLEAQECFGRGKCVCGRCLCDTNPDPDHPTKTVMGEYCEFDNFSCDGPKCNEGPYSLNQPRILEDNLDDI